MNIYVDESGNFKSSVSIVCSLIIPDTIDDYVRRKYKKFEKTIPANELINGEVKGQKLSFGSRLRFFKFLNQFEEIKITPNAIDLDIQSKKALQCPFDKIMISYENSMKEAIRNKDEKRRKELTKVFKIYRKDRSNFVHQVITVYNLHRTIQHLLIYYLDKRYNFCFERIKIFIDRKDKKRTGYEKLTKLGLPMFFHNISRKVPLEIVSDVWGSEHPFRKNFEVNDGINGNKVFRDVSFVDSKDVYGIRMVDIVCNSLYKCLNWNFNNGQQVKQIYGHMTKNFATGPKLGPCFIFLGEEDYIGKEQVPKKYLPFFNY